MPRLFLSPRMVPCELHCPKVARRQGDCPLHVFCTAAHPVILGSCRRLIPTGINICSRCLQWHKTAFPKRLCFLTQICSCVRMAVQTEDVHRPVVWISSAHVDSLSVRDSEILLCLWCAGPALCRGLDSGLWVPCILSLVSHCISEVILDRWFCTGNTVHLWTGLHST